MLRYRTDLMRHIYSLKSWIVKTGSTGNIEMETLAARIKHRERDLYLRPQFVTKLEDGRLGYTSQLGPATVGFVGWLPYSAKVWPMAQDKLEFKRFVEQNGLRTPRFTTDASQIDYPFIIKAARSSFGYGIRGPYSPSEIDLPEIKLQPGEYYEEIVFGKIARAWYWNTTLAALELFDMPKITGDGKSSLTGAIRNVIGAEGHMPTSLDRIAAIQGLSEGGPLPAGREVVADYRYVSALNPSIYKNYNVLESIRGSDLYTQFEQVGKIVYRGIPDAIRRDTASVVDAIVNKDGNVWLLEVNCNAQLHPDIYGAMLDDMCTETTALPLSGAYRKSISNVNTPIYNIDIATPADAQKISELRRAALAASKQFSLYNLGDADWSEIDETSIVLTVRSGTDIVASMRMTIFNDVLAAQEFLQYPVARQSIEGPILAMSRAVTLPSRFNTGLMGALRYAYLRVLNGDIGSRIANVVAIVYQGAPRINSMQKVGFVMVDCTEHWDSEAKIVAQPLIAMLPKTAFAGALQQTETEFASSISQCSFDWQRISMRVEQAYVTSE